MGWIQHAAPPEDVASAFDCGTDLRDNAALLSCKVACRDLNLSQTFFHNYAIWCKFFTNI